MVLSVSATTREPRPQERDGIDYFFVSRDEFLKLKESGGLLEWAEVFSNLYGTPAEPVQNALAGGRDVIFDVDWQGAAAISQMLPDDAVRVFILPPSRAELVKRLYGRGTDSDQVIRTRLKAAGEEISHWKEYDYILINENFEESLAALAGIVKAERLKRHRQLNLCRFIDSLMDAKSGSEES
jgi:guanylate kinase